MNILSANSIKRILFLMMGVTIVTVMSACNKKNPSSNQPTAPETTPVASADTVNEDNKEDIYIDTDSENLGVLVFLGGGLTEKELGQSKQQVIDEYLTDVDEIPFYNYGGPEIFCVIPHYVGSSITVKRSELTEQGELVAKETLDTSDKPMIIQCNESDLYSNVMITIKYNDKSTTFTPYISLKDGSVMPADKMEVIDLTKK